ncbi:methionine ABC transporter ATP-binding protein [Virgibacillus sp. 179-BFC.A HS]|uniref:Methionine ABC transporter ATP-binding protein n=1 Tax=Tigheibacillus jepli TaxID=3035914 RepID=A0ABU5CFW6_9BACI|nr:methionine ABC transporter ATP-binding protein [Virgibacillus sp. 179-BFC.A HS]MDY0405212.1 methionine ABC transporter ATP-binding protein [Virgibacillus sp. 179-BFC.A HS]
MIKIDSLTKEFSIGEKKLTAVNDLSLEIQSGEIFGIIGYSGAGKSTFIRLLNRLETPSSGSVTIGDKQITTLSKKDLRNARQDIGMIFQHFNLLWSRTVQDNIAFPLEIAGVGKSERQKRVQELVDLVGLTGREKAYPSQLSGGQKQRVGIARALANRPNVLLCDEATSALDPETTNSILDLLVSINKKLGLTIVMITHEMHVIRKICDRVAVMEKGSIVEQGDVLEVFSHPKMPVTKKFVKQVMGDTDEDEAEMNQLFQNENNRNVLRLHFIGETTNQALISQLAKKFDIDLNILQGKITQTQRGAYGTLFVQLIGDQHEIDKAVQYIDEQTSVEMEVVENER